MISENRKNGIHNISKYLYIFLQSLRKLPKYYPPKNKKLLYRCITHKVSLEKNEDNENIIPYKIGNKKTFWGFTSTSTNPKTTYNFLKNKEKIKSGTIFSLEGDIWGYNIELFNYFNEKEILLEPERKFIIKNALPSINEIINITCKILKTPLILDNDEIEQNIIFNNETSDDDEIDDSNLKKYIIRIEMEIKRNKKPKPDYIYGIGVLCNIPAKNIKVLITYSNIIDLYILNEVKVLRILINNKEKEIDMKISRYKYINEIVTIIEIVDEDHINNFIEIDKFINSKNYTKKNIISVSLNDDDDTKFELIKGKINLKKYDDNYICNIELIKSGIVLLKDNLTLIGIIKNNNNDNQKEIEFIPMNIIINNINNNQNKSGIVLNEYGNIIVRNILDLRKSLFQKKNDKIKFNFENELINYYDEEIKLLIYQYIINSEKKEESKRIQKYWEPYSDEDYCGKLLSAFYLLTDEHFDIVFEKISKTFSQDLIAYLNHYCKTDFPKGVNKINKFYSESVHSNLNAYIKKAKKFINVIYTFSMNEKPDKFYYLIKGFEMLNNKNTRYILTNLIKTVELLEKEIIEFYNSKNAFLIINFEESDSQKLESLLKYLKDFEKNLKFNETNKKITIILIHLKRKKEPYNKDIFISNLSDIPQTFIDDIYGKEILINDIFGLNIKELYENKELIDTQELFREEIYNCFQKIKYIFKDNILYENKYKSTIILNIYNNKELINKIVEKIINEMEKSKEQINFCENIFRNNSFETQENFINNFIFSYKKLTFLFENNLV